MQFDWINQAPQRTKNGCTAERAFLRINCPPGNTGKPGGQQAYK